MRWIATLLVFVVALASVPLPGADSAYAAAPVVGFVDETEALSGPSCDDCESIVADCVRTVCDVSGVMPDIFRKGRVHSARSMPLPTRHYTLSGLNPSPLSRPPKR